MMFGKRVERVFRHLRDKRKEQEPAAPPEDEQGMENQLEKGDLFAMIVSGLGVILPVALVVLLLLAAVGYFFIFR